MFFTKTHEWISIEDHTATIGITDYAQKELGDVVYVELPHLNHKVHAGEPVIVLESTKAAVDVYTPLSGEIVAVNTSLRENPEKVNLAPQKEGWLFQLRLLNNQELDSLMNERQYMEFLRQ